MRKKAFTLIELLVVIAIIALLLSILMPSLQKVKAQAKATVCLSNLRQWALILNMYTSDNNGRYWMDPDPVAQASPERLWMNRLSSLYGDNDEFRICPSGTLKNQFGENHPNADVFGKTDTVWRCGNMTLPNGAIVKYEGSYGINHWLNSVPDSGVWAGGYSGKPQQHFLTDNHSQAGNIPLIMDCVWYGGSPETNPAEAAAKVPEANDWLYDEMVNGGRSDLGYYRIARFCIDRHNSKINGAFMDGSARKVPLEELWKLKWHKTAKPYDVEIPWLK